MKQAEKLNFIKYIFLFLILSCQKELTPNGNLLNEKEEIVCVYPIEQLPEYPGGQTEMFKFIYKNLKPKNTDNTDKYELCTSRVFVKFTVKANGKVENPVIIKGADFCPNLRNELISVIKKMPRWKAGTIGGKLTDINFTIPLHIYFDL